MSIKSMVRSGCLALVVPLFACGGDETPESPGTTNPPAVAPAGSTGAATSPAATTPMGSLGTPGTADPQNMPSTSLPGSGPIASPSGTPMTTPPATDTPPGAMDSGAMGAGMMAQPAAPMAMAGTNEPAAPTGMDMMDAVPEPMMAGPLMYTGEFTATEGATIVSKHKCSRLGDNVSPLLEWSGGPAETKSYALVLFDTQYNLLHWVVWDIPASATSLPEGIQPGYDLAEPAGAHQAAAMGSEPHAYAGPCSSAGLLAGTYEFRLYALNVETLGLSESSMPGEAQAAVEGAAIESVIWTGNPE